MAFRYGTQYLKRDASATSYWYDDFFGDSLGALWTSAGGAGGSAAVVDGETNGICRITTDTDVGDAWHLDWNDIRSYRIAEYAEFEARVLLASVTNVEARFGFDRDADEYCHFDFDDSVQNNWRALTEQPAAGSNIDTGIVADTGWHIFRIETDPAAVRYYIDGALVGTDVTINTIPVTYMEPWFELETEAGAADTMDVDYVELAANRL